MKNPFSFKSRYLVLTGALLLFAVTALVIQHFTAKTGTIARIYQNGTLIQEIDLSAVSKDYTFDITWEDDGYNTIRVTKGAIGVIDANCPDKVCQNMGMVSSTAYPISCLPHKLVIQLEAGDASMDESIDAVLR